MSKLERDRNRHHDPSPRRRGQWHDFEERMKQEKSDLKKQGDTTGAERLDRSIEENRKNQRKKQNRRKRWDTDEEE